MVRPFWGAFSRSILSKNDSKSPLQVFFALVSRRCWEFPNGIGGCFMVFYGVLWCFMVVWVQKLVLRPFWGAFSRPILRKNSAKSPLQVIFRPCIKVVLGVFQWCFMVFYGVLWCFRVV